MPASPRASLVVLQCSGCPRWVKQIVPAFARSHRVLCPVCDMRAMAWLLAEGERLEAAGCQLCDAPSVVGIAWLEDCGWLRCCERCYRMVSGLEQN